jgi:hypothetical protein
VGYGLKLAPQSFANVWRHEFSENKIKELGEAGPYPGRVGGRCSRVDEIDPAIATVAGLVIKMSKGEAAAGAVDWLETTLTLWMS